MELTETRFRIEGDPARLRQVLMNLMINGIEAMSKIEGPRELTIRSTVTGSEHITICISDTGIGLPPFPADQIFKTFFSTKHNGIGLGLSISRTIVEEHGGQLRASNNAAHGATFCLTLPIGRTQ
jgi:signal transduction histidine kinase